MSTAAVSLPRTWGRLLRLPNVFTIPGDILIGAAWIGLNSITVLWAALGICSIYMAGLLLNDYFDRNIDAQERPLRPIPSGAVQPLTVLIAGLLLMGIGIFTVWAGAGLQAGLSAASVSGLVLLYDGGGKKIFLIGPLLMGLCRGGAIVTGMLAVGSSLIAPPLIPALAHVIYILRVTMIAATETKGNPPGMRGYSPVLTIMVAPAVLMTLIDINTINAGGLMVFTAVAVLIVCDATQTNMHKIKVPVFIGRLLRHLIPLQAGWILLLTREPRLIHVVIGTAITAAVALSAKTASNAFYGS